MKKTDAQIHALDRIMYLLEERSFQTLTDDNDSFADIVERLYTQVNHEIVALEARHPRAA